MKESSSTILLQLLRTALGNETEVSLPDDVDWSAVVDLAFNQGVAALMVDGLQKSDTNALLESEELEDLRYELFGEALACEEDYSKLQDTISALAKVYAEAQMDMMLLKDYGLSLNYPIPAHRPTGDIDVFLNDNDDDNDNHLPAWKRGDELIRKRGIEVDEGHEHHTTFQFQGQMVENHYDFINTKAHRDARKIESKLKELAKSGCKEHRMPDGTRILLPSADFNAIFLIRHLGQHISGERITLRQLIDWGLYVNRHSLEIDWEFVSYYWKAIGISEFARCINRICVEQLGLDAEIFHGVLSNNQVLCTRLLNDIISPEFRSDCPQGSFLKEAMFMTRRFIANGWKRRLIYNECLLESFLKGAAIKVKKENREKFIKTKMIKV